MHKKYTILLVVFVLFCPQFMSAGWKLFALSPKEEDCRRQLLCSLDEKGILDKTHYAEYGSRKLTVLDYDIVIMKATCKKILAKKINMENGFFVTIIPGFFKIMQIKSALNLVLLGVGTLSGLCAAYRYPDKSEELIRSLVVVFCCHALSEAIKIKIYSMIHNYYIRKHEEFIEDKLIQWSRMCDIVIQLKEIKKEIAC